MRAASAIIAAACAVTAVALAARHPLQPMLAVAGVLVWTVLAWRAPTLWLLVLPACASWFDFSPWTGWILFSEFDLLVLGALAGGHAARALDPQPQPWPAPWIHAALVALLLLGLWRGFADAAGNGAVSGAGWAFDDAFSPLNTLRVSKVPIALALTAPLLARALQTPDVVHRRIGPGLVIGLTVAAAAAAWERATYPGVLDFSQPYRTVALFWEMHVGGAAIDAYLALSLAWVAWALWQARSGVAWALAAGLALTVAYAALTTFSRGVYLAAVVTLVALGTLVPHPRRDWRFLLMRALMLGVAIASLVLSALWFGAPGVLAMVAALVAAWLWRQRHRWHLPWRQAFAGALVLALIAETVAIFGAGTFMSGRLVRSAQDSGNRLAHWQRGVGLLHGPAEWLLGLGAGRLPAHYEAFTLEGVRWGGARWLTDGRLELRGPRRLPMHAGAEGLVQRVRPLARAQVAFKVSTTRGARVQATLCEAHLLYDLACQGAVVTVPPLREGEVRLVVLPLQGPPLHRPATLTLSVGDRGGVARIDDVVLSGDGRPQWLRNGGFDRGLAHWLPVARHHFLPWHIDSLPLELLIERGLLGLGVGFALGVAALVAGVRAARAGRAEAAFVVASLAGVVTVGAVSSVLDVPRVAWLAGLMELLALQLRPAAGRTPPGTAPPSPAG